MMKAIFLHTPLILDRCPLPFLHSVTLSLRSWIVFCMEACWAWRDWASLSADSSWLESVSRQWIMSSGMWILVLTNGGHYHQTPSVKVLRFMINQPCGQSNNNLHVLWQLLHPPYQPFLAHGGQWWQCYRYHYHHVIRVDATGMINLSRLSNQCHTNDTRYTPTLSR